MTRAFLGIDVGTGSARAGLFDVHGTLLSVGKHDIRLHRGPGGIVEQESGDIWNAVCAATRSALAKVGPVDLCGIGVDAACSLVVEGQQLSDGGAAERDVIVWMDHRATREAAEINATEHRVLQYVGGTISPEMQTPKLLWLARHRPAAFAQATQFMDLADWLTFRMTGSPARSLCTVTCKWTYLAHDGGWDASYFRQIGLGTLADDGFSRIGAEVVAPGACVGNLTATAAQAMGLAQGIPVAAGLIDAHAAGVGTLGDRPAGRLAYVFGTSACTMSSHAKPVQVKGVWGPYYHAMLPDLWLNEGGQSAAGAALDQLVRLHPAYTEIAARERNVLDALTRQAQAISHPAQRIARAAHLTVIPDFNGNRAPLADPSARAVVAGLGMERDEASLLDLFLAGLIGIACGLRQIIDAQAEMGLATRDIVVSGGAGANPVAQQILADVTGRPVLVPQTEEPVLLGAAILGRLAAEKSQDFTSLMGEMTRFGQSVTPTAGTSGTCDAVYHRFLALQNAAAL